MKMLVVLIPIRPSSFIPSVKYISSSLRNKQLRKRVTIPYLDANLEFETNLEKQITVDQKTQFEIKIDWINYNGLLVPNENKNISIDVKKISHLIESCFKGQSEFVSSFLDDFCCFCKFGSKARVVNLIGQSGSGKTFFAKLLKESIEGVEIIDCTQLENSLEALNRITVLKRPGIVVLENFDFVNNSLYDFESFESKLIGRFWFCIEKLSQSLLYFVITSEKQIKSNLLFIDKYFWINWYSFEQATELLKYFGCSDHQLNILAKRMEGFFPCEISFILQLIQSSNEPIDKIIQCNYPTRLEQKQSFSLVEIIGMKESRSLTLHYLNLFVNHPNSHCKGLIICGSSGTGKTLLVRTLAREFFSVGLNFLFVDPSQIRSKYLGNSEKALRNIFERAKSFPKCVLVFDQFESLFSSPKFTGCFLREMDENQSCFVIGITQHLTRLDEAIIRPGRLYPHILCTPLNDEERREFIFQSKYPVSLLEDEVRVVLDKTKHFTGAQMNGLMQRAALHALQRNNMDSTAILFGDFAIGC